MKKLYFLSFLLFNFIVNAQIVNIPDANFKSYLTTTTPSYGSTISPEFDENGNITNFTYTLIDTNGDGEIQVAEAEAVKYLYVGGWLPIQDLTGLEAFINLESFEMYFNNGIATVDLTQLNNLIGVHISNCDVTTVLFSPSSLSLKSILCDVTNITSLDLSVCPNLRFLNLTVNYLSSLDLSQNTELRTLTCNYSMLLDSLDLSQCVNLETLNCSDSYYLNRLFIKTGLPINFSNLDISNCPSLSYICTDDQNIGGMQDLVDQLGYTCHVNDYCSFVPGVDFYEIEGGIKWDYNEDGCDAFDTNFRHLSLTATDGTTTRTIIPNLNGNGDYYIPVQPGTYTIEPHAENPTYFTISPPSFTVDFSAQASPFTQDFCVTANGDHSDLDIVLIPLNDPRPGFDADYLISCRNIGNRIENGTITFYSQNSDLTPFIFSSPSYDELVGAEYKWSFTDLEPFDEITIFIKLSVNSLTDTPPVNIGDFLGFEAFVELDLNEDEDLWNNYSNIEQTVVGSYDPNDKTCLEGEVIGPSMIGKYAHYVIRFENTGTYPAQNIVVKDMIDASKFDLSSLVPLHSSHDFYTRIKDNKVEFIFENINLDFNDATNDGYVAFKIKTLPTLTVGDTFSNEANIYFDYNFPITTNNYVTTIQALSNPSFEFESEFALYPNPVKDILNISSKNQAEIKSVEIYNIIGQLVIVVPNAVQNIDVSSLESGTYFVKVNSEKGSGNTKFIKE